MNHINKTIRLFFGISLALMALLLTNVGFGKEQHGHQHVHQHGHAELSIAFEGLNGKIELRTPADTIFGFEYMPKTEAQKKLVVDKTAEIESKISTMIIFSKDSDCKIVKEKFERIQEGKNHSEMNFTFKVQCLKTLVGTKIQFDLQKFMPKAKDIDLQLIVDSIQKSIEINKNETTLEIQ